MISTRLRFNKRQFLNKKQNFLLSGSLALAGAGLYWYLTEEEEAKSKYHGIVIFGVFSIVVVFTVHFEGPW